MQRIDRMRHIHRFRIHAQAQLRRGRFPHNQRALLLQCGDGGIGSLSVIGAVLGTLRRGHPGDIIEVFRR